jgi:adenylate cyclase
MAARELGLDLERAQVELNRGRIVLTGSNGVQRILPVDGRGQFLIDWSLRVEDPRIAKQPIEALLARDNKRERNETNGLADFFRDKLVVIGSTATGNDLSDRGATPLAKDTFLTSQHWNVINSVLLGRFIRPSSYLFELGMILLLGLGAALVNWKLRAISATVWVAGLGGVYLLASLYAFVSFRYATPIVLPLLGVLVIHFGLLSYRVVFEQNERKRVKSVFAKIVSPNVVNELLRAEKLSLGGARRMITVFFADIRGFTEMTDITQAKAEEHVKTHNLMGAAAEKYFEEQSRDVLGTVNLYLSIIADTVKKHGGTLDKYIGDCVMAFWGAPTPNEQHAVDCVRSVIDAQRAIFTLNQQRAAENTRRQEENQARAAGGEPPWPLLTLLTLGSGINTGVVTVGLMGSDAHIVNYTVFGRDVNLAARLEAFSGRGRIIIGEATFKELLRDDPALAGTCKELPPATMKGIRMAVKIYEVPWAQAPIAVVEDTQTHWRLKVEKVA